MGFRRASFFQIVSERIKRWREGALWWIGYPAYLTSTAFMAVGRALARAWSTRRFRYLVQGLPALFGMIGVVVCGTLAFANRSAERRSNLAIDYVLQTEQRRKLASFVEQDIKTLREKNDIPASDKKAQLKVLEDNKAALLAEARTFVERALQLEPGNRDDILFVYAEVLEQSGDVEHCRAIMEKLGPDEGPRYAAAHYWRGNDVQRRFPDSVAVRKKMEQQFLWTIRASAKQDTRDVMMASFQLGNLYANTGQYQKAVKYLEKTERDIPLQRLKLAEVYTALGRKEDARRMLESAERHFRTALSRRIEDKFARALLVNALLGEDKYQEAVQVLEEGNTLFPSEKQFKNTIAETYARWVAFIARQPGDTLEKQLALIQAGLIANPLDYHLLARLEEIGRSKGPEGEKAQKLLLEGRNGPVIQHLLASRAYAENKIEEAKFHWERALAMENSDFTPAVMNNLAWIYAHQKVIGRDSAAQVVDWFRPNPMTAITNAAWVYVANRDLKKALDMIDMVVTKYPSVPQFHGTRGEIFTLLGRYDEALSDLEFAIRSQPDSISLHEALAECYEKHPSHGGSPTMAEEHRKKVRELMQKAVRPKLPDFPIPADKIPLDPPRPSADVEPKKPG